MVVPALPAGVLVQLVHDGVGEREVETDVEDRLVPAEVRAVTERRIRVEIEPRVQPLRLGRGESQRQAAARVLERRHDHPLVEGAPAREAEDPGGDRDTVRALAAEAVALVVVGRDTVADRMALRDREVAALVDLGQRLVERAQHGDPGVEPEEPLALDMRPDPRLPGPALAPVRHEGRDRAQLHAADSLGEPALESTEPEVEKDDPVESVPRIGLHRPHQVEQPIAVPLARAGRKDRSHRR